jgi:acyl-CoA-binding protein
MIGIFDTSSVARCVEILLEYLMLDFFFSGGYVYYLFEMFYILTFESFVRQPRTAARVALDKLKPVPDHENPLVIGRKRRPAHAPLRSFEDKRSALLYWSKTYHSLTRKYIPQCGSKLDQPVQNSRNVNGGKNRIEKNPSNAPSTPPVSPKRTSLFSTLSAAFSRTPPPASQIKETESSDEDDANDHDENSGSEDVDRSSLTPNIYMLSGLAGQPDASAPWRFTLIGSPSDAPMGWEHTQYDEETSIWKTTGDKGDDVSEKSDSPTWVDMSVPSHWQLQGHDIPIYTNTSYPFQFDPPRARRTGKWRVADCDAGIGCSPETQHPRGSSLHELEPGENATGLYRKTFSLPSDWEASNSGERVFLCFEGVDSCMHVYVNGNYVGYSQDSCLPAEYDITDALLDNTDSATHTLAVQVMRWCDGSYLEDQDKWWLSGIYREVYLMKKPSSFISDYEINTDLETVNDTSTATITVSVLVEKFINSLSASNNASNDTGAEAAVIQGDMQGMNGSASIKEQFDDCVERLKHVDTKFDNDTKLRMYALFKQASTPTGPTSARPGIFDPVAGAKWDAWKKVGGLSKEQAMEEYVQLITGLIGVNEALVGVGSESGVGAVGNPLAGNLQNASNNNDEVALNHYAIRAEVYEVGSLACSLSDRAAVMEKFSTHANPVAARVGTLEINREFPSKEEADGLDCSTMAAVDIGLGRCLICLITVWIGITF